MLNKSLENCEIEQMKQFQDAVKSKFENTQFELLDILKTSIFNQDYGPIIRIKDYIEKADLLDMVETIYLESMVGNMQMYGIAEKESNIGELTRYYFILSRLIQNLDSNDGFCFEYNQTEKSDNKNGPNLLATQM